MTRCVLEWLDAAAEQAPGAPAFEDARQALTWGEAWTRRRPF